MNYIPQPSFKHFQPLITQPLSTSRIQPQHRFKVFWVAGEYNKEMDEIYKTIDFGDWHTPQHLTFLEQHREKYDKQEPTY